MKSCMNRDLSESSFTILVGLTISYRPNPPRCKQHGGNVRTETSRSTGSLQLTGRGGPRKDTGLQHLCRAFKNNLAEDGCHNNHLELLTRRRDMPRCPQRSATSENVAAIAGCGNDGARTVSPLRGRPSCGAHTRPHHKRVQTCTIRRRVWKKKQLSTTSTTSKA